MIEIIAIVFFVQAIVSFLIYMGALIRYSLYDSGKLNKKILDISLLASFVFLALCAITGLVKFLLTLNCSTFT